MHIVENLPNICGQLLGEDVGNSEFELFVIFCARLLCIQLIVSRDCTHVVSRARMSSLVNYISV